MYFNIHILKHDHAQRKAFYYSFDFILQIYFSFIPKFHFYEKMKLQMAYNYHEKNSELGKDKSSSPIHRRKELWGDINNLPMYMYDFSKSENRYFSYSFKLKVFRCAQRFNI